MPQLPGGGGTSDDMITVGLSIAQAINETRAALVAVAARTAPGSYSGTELAAGAASFTVPIPLTADLVEIDLSVSPVIGGGDLWARFTQGGVPLSGATDYMWANLRAASFSNSGADAKFQVATSLLGAVGSLRLRAFKPNGSSNRKTLTWDGFFVDNATSFPITINGGGRFMLNTNIPIDGIQFLFSAGAVSPAFIGTKYTAFSA